MKLKRFTSLIVLNLITAGALYAQTEAQSLVFKRPAGTYLEALPMGNGKLDASIWRYQHQPDRFK